jgi:putative spermidine/putrescine transport system permease protein
MPNDILQSGPLASGENRGALLAAPALAVVVLVVLVPTFQLLLYSFRHYEPGQVMQAALTLENYTRFFTERYYLNILVDTFRLAAICTVVALVLGFPVAYFLARTQSKYKTLWVILLVFPLLVGNVVRAAGWMVILGNAGFVNALMMSVGIIDQPVRLLYTPSAAIIGTAAVVLPYMIITLQSVLEGIDRSIEEAARNLGADAASTFRRVTLPMSAPGVAAGTMLVFILCMNAYATPVLLGGTSITVMTPAIYSQIAQVSNWPFGAALAFILMIVTLAMALGSNWLIHRRYAKTMMA